MVLMRFSLQLYCQVTVLRNCPRYVVEPELQCTALSESARVCQTMFLSAR